MSDANSNVGAIGQLLAETWLGVPMLLWICFLIVFLVVVLRAPNVRLNFIGRDRKFSLEAREKGKPFSKSGDDATK